MATVINAVTGTGLTQTADASGIIKIQSNSVTTNALAWVNFNGIATVSIRASYNVSSITRISTGYYTISFSTATTDANYSVSGNYSASYGTRFNGGVTLFTNPTGVVEVAPTTSSFNIITTDIAGNAIDPKYVTLTILGN